MDFGFLGFGFLGFDFCLLGFDFCLLCFDCLCFDCLCFYCLCFGMASTLRSAPVACAVGLSAASHRLTTTPASSSTYDTHGPSGWEAEP